MKKLQIVGDGATLAAWMVGLALLAVGLSSTGILRSHVLNAAQARDMGLVALVVVGIAGAMAWWRSRATVVFATASVLAALILFGWAATILVFIAFIAFSCTGEAILGPAGADSVDSPLWLAAGLGAACYALVLSITVHFPINTRLLFGVLLFLPLLHSPARHRVRDRLRASLCAMSEARVPQIAGAACLAVVVVLHAIGAALPERYYDALSTHLYVGQIVSRLAYFPFNHHDYAWALMPMGVDWLIAIGTSLAGEHGAKAIGFLLFLLLGGNIVAFLRRRGARPSLAALIAALFLSAPLAYIESATLFIENGLALFFLCAFAVLQFPQYPAERRALACAILISAAVATKLHGVVLAVPFGFATLLLLLRAERHRLFAGFAGICAVAMGLLPYAFAYLRSRNPVFPYFNAVFLSPDWDPSNFVDARWTQAPPYDMFFNMTFHSSRYLEAGDGAFGFHILCCLPAAVVAAIATRDRAALVSLSAALYYIFCVATAADYLRYLYPALPLLAVGFVALCRDGSKPSFARPFVPIVFLLLIALNLFYYPSGAWILGDLHLAALGSESRWEKVGDDAVPLRALVRRANAESLPGPRVLLFGQSVNAGLDGTMLDTDWHGTDIHAPFDRAQSDSDVEAALRKVKATHAIVKIEPDAAKHAALIASSIAARGEAVSQVQDYVLYRLPPEIWLGPSLLGDTPLSAALHDWNVHGLTQWQPIGPALAGKSAGVLLVGPDARIERSVPVPIRPHWLYRVSLDLACASPDQRITVTVLYRDQNDRFLSAEGQLALCGVIGSARRTIDFIAPSRAAAASLSLGYRAPQALLAGVDVQEGYSTHE